MSHRSEVFARTQFPSEASEVLEADPWLSKFEKQEEVILPDLAHNNRWSDFGHKYTISFFCMMRLLL